MSIYSTQGTIKRQKNSKQDHNETYSISNIERVQYPNERKRQMSLEMLSSLDEIANDII